MDVLSYLTEFGSLAGVLVVVFFFLKHMRSREQDHNEAMLAFAQRLNAIGQECHTRQKEIADNFQETVRTVSKEHCEGMREVTAELRAMRKNLPPEASAP